MLNTTTTEVTLDSLECQFLGLFFFVFLIPRLMDSQQLLKLVLAVVVVFVLYKLARRWAGKKGVAFASGTPRVSSYVPLNDSGYDTVPPAGAPEATTTPAKGSSQMPAINVATDLLPKPSSPQVMDFGEFAPTALQGQNFLDVSQQLGIDTQGSSMKNANYQLRSDPPNPRTNVGPWLNSTVEADLLRRPLE